MAANLTLTAERNSAKHRAAADDAIATDASGTRRRFRDLIRHSVFSTNVDAFKIPVFNTAGEILDARSVETQRCGGNRARGLREFRRRQGAWLVRRQGFEDLWKHGRRFVYGAVNAGGMGAEGPFGRFCIVVSDPERPAPDALAVFPGDSASRYTDASGRVNAIRAMSEATSWQDRCALGTTELGADALLIHSAGWPSVICHPRRYLEAARAGSLPITGVAEIRIRAEYRINLDEWRGSFLAGDPLTSEQANQVAAYDVVHSWRRSHGTAINDVI